MRWTKTTIFRLFMLFFIAGVAVRSFFIVDVFWLYLGFLTCLVLMVVLWRWASWRWLSLGTIILILGIGRYEMALPINDASKIWFYNGQRVGFQAIVSELPDVRINQTKLTVTARQIDGRPVSGKVLVSTGLYPKRNYGDVLSISCQLNAPEPFDEFAYDRYLAKSNIYSLCRQARIHVVATRQANVLIQAIMNFRNHLQAIINSNLPEPQASFLSAITLGARRGLPPAVIDAFSRSGTSHLVAISGLHITLLITIMMQVALSLYIPRRQAFWFITLILVGYLVLIDFPPSAVRASVMGWLVMFALYVGRLNQSSNALFLVAAIMLFLNPKILRDDVGFQLSFLAVLGLIYLAPLFEKFVKIFPDQIGIRESLQMTLAAQITTLPIIVYNFGRISLIAPLVNIIVLPLIPYLMIISFATLGFSLILPTFSQFIFWPSWALLSLILKIIIGLGSVPGAALDL